MKKMANKKVLDFRKSVTEKFIENLKKDGLAWKQGWDAGSLMPSNGKTGTLYKGLNRLNLILLSKHFGYSDTRWLTFNQIKEAGYHLEKDSKGAKVEYWYPYDDENKKAITWKEYQDYIKAGRKEEEFSLFSKLYTVFNGDNVKGLPEKVEYFNKDVKPDKIIDELSKNMNVPIIHEADEFSAYYIPSKDEIHLPLPERFFNRNEYNHTALHELAHSTGHENRLNRDIGEVFSKEYAYEELIAEITSVFMSAYTGIKLVDIDIDNHSAYINGWIEELEKSPDMLVKAVKEAERASDYMEEHIEISKELSISVEKPFESDYMLLGRLASDCEYYLGWGGGAVEALYYHDERSHIEEMKKLYEKLPVKPEWLTLEQLKEYEKLLLNKEIDISRSFNDKFYKFGVLLTSKNEIEALNRDGCWVKWFDKDGKCMGNTEELNIWFSERGNFNLNYENFNEFLKPTYEDAISMVKSIAENYNIASSALSMEKVIDMEDFSKLNINSPADKTSELFKNIDKKTLADKSVDTLEEIFKSNKLKEKNLKEYLKMNDELEI